MDIPDKIGGVELETLLAGALEEMKEQADASGPYGGHSKEALIALVEEHKDEMLEKVKDPMAHKLLALMIMQHFIDWHIQIAKDHVEDGHNSGSIAQMGCGLGWAEDLGKLKAAYEIFRQVGLGKHDFTCGDDD